MQLCPPSNIGRSGHFCICNRVRGYAKTIRRIRLQRIPNGRTFPVSFMTCTQLVRKWRTCREDQGRLMYCKDGFAWGRTQLHMQMCPGGHNCIMHQRPGRPIAYAKPSGGHYCICNNVLRILLHRGHNCMGHPPSRNAQPIKPGTPG